MTDTLTTTAPIVKTIELACSVEHAVDVFVDRMGQWWPLDTHAVTDEPVTVRFPREVGGAITEVGADGTESRWGEVLAFDPPERIVWTWEVSTVNPATQVEVSFADMGEGRCRLRVEHRGWEAFTDPEALAASRGSYTPGWDLVLGCYAEHVGTT